MLSKMQLGKSGRCRKGQELATASLDRDREFPGRGRGFLVTTEFCLVLCRDINSCVATWFSGFKRKGMAMGEGLVLQQDFFFVTIKTDQGRKILRRDKIFVVATEVAVG